MSLIPVSGGTSSNAGGFYPVSIDQSLRFNDDDSAYLNRTFSSEGDLASWTLSTWVKLGNPETTLYFMQTDVANGDGIPFYASDGYSGVRMEINSSGQLQIYASTNGNAPYIGSGTNVRWNATTNAVLRDPSAWYHVVFAVDLDTSPYFKIYVNGEQQTFASSSTTDVGVFRPFNRAKRHNVGAYYRTSASNFADCYLAEYHFIDGQQLTPNSFGELKSGVWIPKEVDVTYGTNGFYLDFANSADIGNDVSGEGNDWTSNNFNAYDVVPDSPTLNFATMNPLQKNGTLAEGNLRASTTDNRGIGSTMHMTSGKWYWEICPTAGTNWHNGVIESDFDPSSEGINSTSAKNGTMYIDGRYYKNGVQQGASGVSTSTGDVIGITFDTSTNEVKWYKNNVYIVGLTLDSGYTYQPATGSGGSPTVVANFGQDSSFAGTKTAQGNSDENGYGDFFYTPPSGFLALCTANLTIPEAIDPAQGSSPEDYFGVDTYAGTSATHERSELNFQPDFVWTKHRNGGSDHQLVDAVRGNTKALRANTADTEDTFTNGILSFDSDGVTLGSNSRYNATSSTYVSWNWNAGGTTTSGTATGNGGSRAYSYRASQDAGVSIVTWTGDGTDAGQVPHGLTDSVDAALVRARNNGVDWHCFFKSGLLSGEGYFLSLNKTDGEGTTSYGRADLNDSSTELTLHAGSNGLRNVNNSGTTYVAYVFKSVEGFSKIGSYSGNNSTDGPFIYLGFRPALFMVKCKNTTGSWYCYDTTRLNYNVMGSQGQPIAWNSNVGEDSGADASWYVDALSNGIKIRNNSNFDNGTNSFIYMAFAENPFKYSNAR